MLQIKINSGANKKILQIQRNNVGFQIKNKCCKLENLLQIKKPQRKWIIKDCFCLCTIVRRKKNKIRNGKSNEKVNKDVNVTMCTFWGVNWLKHVDPGLKVIILFNQVNIWRRLK